MTNPRQQRQCGDNCKGECSGEVDGKPHCPMTTQHPAAPQPPAQPQECNGCGTCGNAERTNAPFYPYKCHASKPVPMLVHEYCVGWFRYVGCASHTAASDQRIEQVIKELEKKKLKFLIGNKKDDDCIQSFNNGIEEALALLQQAGGGK